MRATIDKQQSWLLKRFHTLCTKLAIKPYEKEAIVSTYGCISSKDLTVKQLAMACDSLDKRLNPEIVEVDRWRKRVMGVIGGWLRIMSVEQTAEKIKGIACRATNAANFNAIPKERLINIYYAFLKKQKDFKAVDGIAKEELEILTYLN
jgi:hypothetical protein